MEIERQYRDWWAIPQMCCVCGEQSVDGALRPAIVSLGRTAIKGGLLNGVGGLKMTSMSIGFPRCADCEQTTTSLITRLRTALAGRALPDRRRVGSTGSGMRKRRAKRSASPVSITLKEAHNYAPLLRFRFANRRYGEAFSEQNP